MQHSIKDLWLYPFPEIDVVHTQEPLLPEPELTTPGRCICCRQNVRHRFRLDDSWPLRQLTDTISDTRVRLNKATEHLDKLKKRGEPVATGEKEKYNTAVKPLNGRLSRPVCLPDVFHSAMYRKLKSPVQSRCQRKSRNCFMKTVRLTAYVLSATPGIH